MTNTIDFITNCLFLTMLLSIFKAFQSQEHTIAYFITLPVCVINVLPFIALFTLPKTQRRIILISVIGIDSALIATAALLTHQHIYNIGYDTWMHLSLIQRGVEGGLFAGDPYYPGYPTPPHYSIVDIFYILLSAISGVAPHLLWGNFSFIFAALIFLVWIWWHKELLDDTIFSWLAGLIFIMSITIKWHYATYPRNVAFIFFALSHLFYFRSIRVKRDRYTLYCGISIAFCFMSHLFTGIMCLISLVSYILMNWAIDALHRRSRSWIKDLRRLAFIPIGLILSSPWLIAFGKQALAHDDISISHYSLSDWNVKSAILGWTFTHYKPKLFWEIYPNLLWILAGIGLLICLYYIIRGSYKPLHVFLISAAVIPLIVLFTPLYSPIVHVFGEWMPSRFARIISVPPLAAMSSVAILRLLISIRIKPSTFSKACLKAKPLVSLCSSFSKACFGSLGIILGLIFMLIIVPPIITKQNDLYAGRNQALTPLYTWDSDFHDLRDTLRNKVILTDPWTSYILPYYTGAYTAAIPAAHGSPYINHEARLADVSAMFNPQTVPEKRRELLDRYRVEYIMLNLRPKLDATASRYSLIADYYPPSIKDVFDNQGEYKLMYNRNELFVYAVKSNQACKG